MNLNFANAHLEVQKKVLNFFLGYQLFSYKYRNDEQL